MTEKTEVQTTDDWTWGKIIKHVILPKPKGSPKAGKKEIATRLIFVLLCAGIWYTGHLWKEHGSAGSSKPISDYSTQSNSRKEASQEIKGYKNFQFGMAAAEVAKFPECIDGYKIANSNSIATDNKLAELNQRSSGWEEDRQRRIAILEKKLPEDNSDLTEQAIQKAKAEINPIESEIQQLRESDNAFNSFADPMVKRWVAGKFGCSIEVFGEKTFLIPVFEGQKLVSVIVNLGGFNNEKFKKIGQLLSEKYSLSQQYTEEQAQAFNNNQIDHVAVTFENGQIALIAQKRSMSLMYSDGTHASENQKDVIRGQVRSDDL